MFAISNFILPIFWAACVLILSAWPGSGFPKSPFDGFDKLIHLTIYLIFSFLLCRSLYHHFHKIKSLKIYWLGFLLPVFYGMLMEILQEYIFIRRSGDWYDVLANASGALVGLLIFKLWLPKMKKSN